MKFTYLIGTLTVTSALLLAGCSTNETTVNKEATTAQASNVEKEKNVELTKEEKIVELPSPYKEIAKHFAEWELPQEGRIPKTAEGYAEYKEIVDEATPTDESIYFTNGYGFDGKTGHNFIAVYETDEEGQGEPAEPTPDQREGIIMGMVEEWTMDGDYVFDGVPMYYKQNGKKVANQDFVETIKIDINSEKMTDLLKIRSYAEKDKLKPLEDWANQTVGYYVEAIHSEDIEDMWANYKKGQANIKQLNDTFNLARE
ncbi:hypothetical protein [Peribacillus frigoritolerans]|uniref:hypothetical protein n=1 Tax=Peribacillus frigoritolerans TaxID=450367 RepID=UPI002E1FEF03|nr:hypothetical protein [Peribacillus frigoritolerans]MED3845719.1 hypothetical protein [Peribacillus frigoritolerans]